LSSSRNESKGRRVRLAVLFGTFLLLIFLGASTLIVFALGLAILAPAMYWEFLWPRRLRRGALQGILFGDAAVETLRKRYARGEITKDEFSGEMKALQEQV